MAPLKMPFRPKARPRLPFLALVLLLALSSGAAVTAYGLYQDSAYNKALKNPARIEITEDTPAKLVFAKAYQLDRQGDYQEALRLYNSIEYSENARLRERIKYNIATLYLREAAKLWNAQGVWAYARINTLLGLARESYREVLRMNPQNQDARYNLQYAYRIVPPPKEQEESKWQGTKSSVFAILPGLPGGGP